LEYSSTINCSCTWVSIWDRLGRSWTTIRRSGASISSQSGFERLPHGDCVARPHLEGGDAGPAAVDPEVAV
jgi:hypothetical protein